ncbi:putative inner membrane or exported protein [Oceanicola granulosus HTCC2516]|uniref:Putative inner membrane or exported protein n=1 Tax=Oceanicola granulosus (strain ATCC BAA-861 / DSM 15982 / KCTC 12143 / HTCC2516) TaxID=314256 RepID=Q2CJ40_OCEGH|nr:DUF302 domain-containing protein [Oceanicola granulosus]EAR52760.1 putative inner membrane or exported protein [Oceanicola granulosus HTCC2516]
MRLAALAPLVAALAAAPALADIEQTTATGSVAEVMDRLESAVTEAGATVFARVDHGAGAADVEMSLAPAELLIFGNPRLGTPAMQADILAGLHLPLKMLVYTDSEGATRIAWIEPEALFDDLEIDDDAQYVEKMEDALASFAEAAAAG